MSFVGHKRGFGQLDSCCEFAAGKGRETTRADVELVRQTVEFTVSNHFVDFILCCRVSVFCKRTWSLKEIGC